MRTKILSRGERKKLIKLVKEKYGVRLNQLFLRENSKIRIFSGCSRDLLRKFHAVNIVSIGLPFAHWTKNAKFKIIPCASYLLKK